MKLIGYFIVCCMTAGLFAQETSLAAIEGEPSFTIDQCINPISGDYIISETDLIIPGYEPIYFNRTYISGAQEGREARFSIMPHIYMHFIRPKNKKTEPLVLSVAEPSGGMVSYKNLVADHGKDRLQFFPMLGKKTRGLTNTGRGEISSQTNISRNRIILDKSEGAYILTTCNGTKRYYKKPCETPFAYLQKERKPNGNWVFYEYTDYYTLKEIRTTNPNRTKIYAKVRFEHETPNPYNSKTFAAVTDTGKLLHYFFHLDDVKEGKHSHHFFRLNHIERPYLPKETLAYKQLTSKNDTFLIYQRAFDNQTLAEMDYCSSINEQDAIMQRIKTIKQPVGPDGSLVQTHHLVYNVGKYALSKKDKIQNHLENSIGITHHFDAYNKKTEYGFNEHFVPRYIYKFGKDLNNPTSTSDSLLYEEHFHWFFSELTNQLRFKYTKDQNSILSLKSYEYDHKGNVIEDTLIGNLSGHSSETINFTSYCRKKAFPAKETYTIKNSYYDNDLSLIHTKMLPNGCAYEYTYLPNTNLVTARYTLHANSIKLRDFYIYNEDHVVVQEITDDGINYDQNDLAGVTQRLLRSITPRQSQPALNFPEVIEESYLDLTTSTYHLLKKSILSYSINCDVIEEALYDANNQYVYSLYKNYDDRNRPTMCKDGLGRTSTFSYNGFNHLTEEKLGNSALHISHSYDILGREFSFRSLDSKGRTKETKFYHDLKSRLIKTVDSSHNITEFAYDDLDHETLTILPATLDPDGHRKRPTIKKINDIYGNPLQETDPLGYTTKTSYNSFGKPSHIVYSDGTQETFIYHSDGSLQTHISVTGLKTLYSYDFLGRVLSKKVLSKDNALLYEELSTYNALQLLTHLDKNNVKTLYRYDGAGRKIEELKTKQGETLARECYTYDALGRHSKTITYNDRNSSSHQVLIKEFDQANRLIEERQEDIAGKIFSRIQYRYDHRDNKIAIIHYLDTGSSALEFFTYDDDNRLVSYTDSEGYITHTQYIDRIYNPKTDSYDSETIITDPLGRLRKERYSSTKELMSITSLNSLGEILSEENFYYDLNGNKVKQKSRIFNQNLLLHELTTLWEYDSRNRIITQIEAYQDPSQKVTRFSYTQDGQEKQVIQADGTSINYCYDSLSRLIEMRSSEGSIHYRFVYNECDQIIEETNCLTKAKTLRSYNARGDLIQETLANGLTLHKEFDGLTRKTKLILPDHSEVHYEFDAFHLKTIGRYNSNQLLEYDHHYLTYNLKHQPTEENCIFNLCTTSKEYNSQNRHIAITSPYFSDTFTEIDPCQRILSRHISSDLQTYDTSYLYDDLDHLIQEDGLFQNTYTFDSHHARLNHSGNAYTNNALDEVLQDGNASYGYSPNGERSLKIIKKRALHYEYDALHRLTALKSDSIEIFFTYDSWHRRLSKTVKQLDFLGYWKVYSEEKYLYDDENEIASLDPQGHIKQLRILGLGKGADIGASVALEFDGIVYAPFHDLLGNIVSLVHSEKNYVAESYRYNAFGEELLYNYYHFTLQDSWINNPWRYQSKRIDEESGLVFFGKRYYDPKVGSWLSPDPLGLTQGLNLYQFLEGNPLSFIDFYGLATETQDSDDDLNLPPPVTGRPPSTIFPPTDFNPYGYLINPLETTPPGCSIPPRAAIPRNVPHYTPYVSPRVYPVSHQIPYTQAYAYHKQYDFAFINGINTSLYEAMEMSSSIASALNYKVNLFYNQTNGVASDVLAVRRHHKNAPLSITRELSLYLRRQVSSGRDVYLFAHSAGGVISHNALQKLPESYREHVHVITFGAAKYIPESFAKSVQNYVSGWDLVAVLSNEWHASLNNRKSAYSVVQNDKIPISWLQPHVHKTMKEHAFMGRTYQEALRDTCTYIKTKRKI